MSKLSNHFKKMTKIVHVCPTEGVVVNMLVAIANEA